VVLYSRGEEAAAAEALQSGADDIIVLEDSPAHYDLLAGLVQRQIRLAGTFNDLESFCFTMSHDLQAPLRRLSGWIDLLLTDCADELGETARNYLDRIDKNSKEMRSLIRSLLRLSTIMRMDLKRDEVNLSIIARSIADRLKAAQPERDCEFVIADAVTCTGDPNLLKLVLENLIGNAWKFTGREERPRIEFGVETREGRPAFFVRDNGIGFDQKLADKVFAPFQRLHREEDIGGAGIGLATVKRIIRRHGGSVWAEGRPGEGATLYFSLE
jgi:light-regulated signal transduction histidine kinase (bacteriophytochrome)